ncbi:ABC transporter ATP-binding protein [Christensenellaceae bacterium OttesenSCG-928-K19]|nr:ABC transporter ATP-binding protein [Christensenellaceae bacterium OttesenSCG-928-K19]
MSILQAKEVKKHYGEDENLVKALDGVSITIMPGEFVSIVGASGSGKSTLLHMLGGLDNPTSGSVEIGGQDISQLSDDKLTVFRRRQIGFVFQNYNLVPILNVFENIVLPVELDGKKVERDYIDRIISLLGLESKLNSLPSNLSGGQQQRVAIARALATKPSILLADEPTGNLDSHTSMDVLNLLQMTNRQFSQTVVMITHNDEIANLADRKLHMADGRIMQPLEAKYCGRQNMRMGAWA